MINKVMTCEDALLFYGRLNLEGQKYFLSSLAFQLTILARDAYAEDSAYTTKPGLLRSINEIQHKILSHLLHILKGDKQRYPDEVLFKTLFQIADTDGYLGVLQIALALAAQHSQLNHGLG